MRCLGKVDSLPHTRTSNCRIIGQQVLEATEALIEGLFLKTIGVAVCL
jgi:hypothetical protein